MAAWKMFIPVENKSARLKIRAAFSIRCVDGIRLKLDVRAGKN
jgi:hypothetical protein